MILDAIRYIPAYDQVVIVSGAGATISVAEKAHENGKRVIVAAFEKAGDLNQELKARADKLVQLDASFRFVKKDSTQRRFDGR